jgi:hypothetical protein
MITEREVEATELSITKKDFYQIWNELLDTATKISDRWTPSETNESDPGIVLLKLLTANADRLNYNIDKNILEDYLPSAAQEESMRKLCEMLSYSMKYYQSATTNVTIYYKGDADTEFQAENLEDVTELILPKFSNIQNTDGDINYVTTEQISFNKNNTTASVKCIQGTIKYCEEENNKIVTLDNLDENNRYYFSVNNVAENGIFINNINDSEMWNKVDNINSIALNKKCYKFGYDSTEMLPYIQFPSDISSIIEDGLQIIYIVTDGINGNVKAKALNTLITPSGWDYTDEDTEYNKTKISHKGDEFGVYNPNESKNGSDKETIDSAYENYKKVAGTFDTLITCRDYMNKIYQLTVSDVDTTPLVSNIIVSDIRDDINKSITICSFNEFGIKYLDEPLYNTTSTTYYNENDTDKQYPVTIKTNEPKINNFDLILYPFKTIYNLGTKTEHDNSFKYDNSNYDKIVEELNDYKTISHSFNLPIKDTEYTNSTGKYKSNTSDIVLIKNYLKLSAKLTTVQKVNEAEQKEIKKNIKTAIYNSFNLRKLDFGEEIPFDNILDTIQNADTRIKNISLDEPVLYTRFLLADGSEYDTAVSYNNEADMKKLMCNSEYQAYNKSNDKTYWRQQRELLARSIYNKLAIRNILAGRVSLFNYDTEFIPSVTESKFESTDPEKPISTLYPTGEDPIHSLIPSLVINNVPTTASSPTAPIEENTNIVLKDNQIIQFRAPNFYSTITYPAYVNYFIHLNDAEISSAVPAVMHSIASWLTTDRVKDVALFTGSNLDNTNLTKVTWDPAQGEEYFNQQKKIFNSIVSNYLCMINKETKEIVTEWKDYEFTSDISSEITTTETTDTEITPEEYVILELNSETFVIWTRYFRKLFNDETEGIYRIYSTDVTTIIGKLVDENHNKYKLCNIYTTVTSPLTYYYIPVDSKGNYKADNLGKDAVYNTVSANSEYELKNNEYLCINYTSSETSADTSTIEDTGNTTLSTTSEVINQYYGPGTIIKSKTDLIDSVKKRDSGTSYSKTEGFDFSASLGTNWKKLVKGMFSLGADEQIEIRKKADTQIYDNSENSKVYIYFLLNNEVQDENGNIIFLKNGESRTLEENEYFWYTDKNMTTITYCGNGTELTNNTGVDIKKLYNNTWTSVESIESTDISLIPWIALTNLRYDSNNPEASTNKYIEWTEYQYITLGVTDTLKCCTVDNNSITSEWKNITISSDNPTKYILNGTEEELPEIILNDKSQNIWQVRTRLSINTGSSKTQTLLSTSYNSKNPNAASCEESIQLLGEDDKDLGTLTGNNLSIKSNYSIESSSDKIQVYFTQTTDSEEVDIITDFKIKTFEDNPITIKENTNQPETITLNNLSNYFTSFTFADGEKDKIYSTLHCILPIENNEDESDYGVTIPYNKGIIMFYYNSQNTTVTDNAFIRFSNTKATPSIYNLSDNNSWWEGRDLPEENPTNYYLKPNAVNVIIINYSTDIEIYCGKSQEDALIFSPLRLLKFINREEGINQDVLKYQSPLLSNSELSKVWAIYQIKQDLRKYDSEHKFFYNAIIDNSVALNINEYIGENLATPTIWYDYNNMNNKFVISEIDTNYIDNGITFANSSIKTE